MAKQTATPDVAALSKLADEMFANIFQQNSLLRIANDIGYDAPEEKIEALIKAASRLNGDIFEQHQELKKLIGEGE